MTPAKDDDQDQTSDMSGTRAASSVAERSASMVGRLTGEPLAPGLYLVATPIGNLADITLRALSVLARADVVYCEDTRHSRTLLSHFAIKSRLEPYHEHNASEQRPRILAALERGSRIALVSDAGTPIVSDPGFKLARDAATAGHAVISLPGPSAVLTALTSSGLPADTFLFAGFLPAKSGARQTRIRELASVPATLIFYEAPQRLSDCLADLVAVLGPRPAAVARELTKLHEEVLRGTLADLAARFEAGEVKGEIVLLVGPPVAVEVSDNEIRARLEVALATMSLRDAARAVADALGVAKSRVYDLGLAMGRERR